jgi:tRNA threonylcarbamoyl adenosine modification protein (Sua5/YciO/YrdC/YwlC family)
MRNALRRHLTKGKRATHQARHVTTTVAPIVEVNPEKPDDAVLLRALEVVRVGGILAFPTDTLYGIGCALGQTASAERIQSLRGIDTTKRPFTLMLPDIGALPHYAVVNEPAYRVLTRIFPGPYCAELVASRKVPVSPGNDQRTTIGVRIPQSRLCEKLLWRLGRPLLTVTAKAPDGRILTTAKMIQDEYGTKVDLILDGGELAGAPSTVVSLVDEWVAVLREGRGPTDRVLPRPQTPS